LTTQGLDIKPFHDQYLDCPTFTTNRFLCMFNSVFDISRIALKLMVKQRNNDYKNRFARERRLLKPGKDEIYSLYFSVYDLVSTQESKDRYGKNREGD